MQSSSSLFEALFKRDIANTGNPEYLQQLAEKYPFFAPAQFYLLQQKDQQVDDYNKQAAKTSVLFNNSYWLNFQLKQMQQPVIETIAPVEMAIAVIGENTTVDKIQEQSEIAAIKTAPVVVSHIANEILTFEPLHITDYFASQGIKLSEEIQPTDKLGKQLKSFTDWLKTMKKINSDRIEIDLNAQTDSTVQTLAERSNTEGEVLTETMAEILIQQGKAGKAIEVYEKLSLLNPSKIVYFAAKIEQLKEH